MALGILIILIAALLIAALTKRFSLAKTLLAFLAGVVILLVVFLYFHIGAEGM